jgi:hypothetical protein
MNRQPDDILKRRNYRYGGSPASGPLRGTAGQELFFTEFFVILKNENIFPEQIFWQYLLL